MLDIPEKTQELIAKMKAATPFAAEFSSETLARVRLQLAGRKIEARQTVTAVHYAGDEGGIVCTLDIDDQGPVITSLTHLHIARGLPFADAVLAYQKHRIKKLKKIQNASGRTWPG
jgi:hypothetical protein